MKVLLLKRTSMSLSSGSSVLGERDNFLTYQMKIFETQPYAVSTYNNNCMKTLYCLILCTFSFVSLI